MHTTLDDWLFSLDWRTSEGNHHNQPGQSRMTLNLTSSAPVLIGCADHHANTAASPETTVTKLSTFSGQTDDVRNVSSHIDTKILSSYSVALQMLLIR